MTTLTVTIHANPLHNLLPSHPTASDLEKMIQETARGTFDERQIELLTDELMNHIDAYAFRLRYEKEMQR